MEGYLEGTDSFATDHKDAPKCKCQYEHCEACGFCSLQFFRGFSYFFVRWRNAMEGHLRAALNLRRHELVSMFLSTLSSLTFLLIVSLLNISHGPQKGCQKKPHTSYEGREESDMNAKTPDQDVVPSLDASLSRDSVIKGGEEISGLNNNTFDSHRIIWDDIFSHGSTKTNEGMESHHEWIHLERRCQTDMDPLKGFEFNHQVEDDENYQEDGNEDVYQKNDQSDIVFPENSQECSCRSSHDTDHWSDDTEGENVNDASTYCHDDDDDDDDIWSDEDLVSSHLKGFPPPISILANETHPGLPEHMSRTFWRSVKRGGRFVLQELQAQPNEFFLATRNNGRLRLELVRTDLDLYEDYVSTKAEESLEVGELAVHNVKHAGKGKREEDLCCEQSKHLVVHNKKPVEEGKDLHVHIEDSCSGQMTKCQKTCDDEDMPGKSIMTCDLSDSSILEASKSNGNSICETMPCEKMISDNISEDISIPAMKESRSSLKVDLDRYGCSKAMIQACT